MRSIVPAIGALRERVTFQEKATVADLGGGRSKAWANISSVPTVSAKVLPVNGREAEDADRVATIQTYLVVVRHRSDITPSHRVVWDSKNLNIRSATNRDMKNRFLWLECEEGVAQ